VIASSIGVAKCDKGRVRSLTKNDHFGKWDESQSVSQFEFPPKKGSDEWACPFDPASSFSIR
jgi:hypothetical protein